MTTLDRTHDASRRSWVASANGHADFPLQNLPLGVFTPQGGAKRGGTLIALLALGAGARTALRQAVFDLLAEDAPAAIRNLAPDILHAASDCEVHLPAAIGDYTDFFAGIQHAINAGRMFRSEDDPLLPNYKYVPVGYHGRASSVRPSGMAVRRPLGQRKRGNEDAPSYGPCRNLDYELEMGIWIGAGNTLGEPVPIAQAGRHIAGFCLLNDWSARDIQAWESQPLGPFLAKNFQTSIPRPANSASGRRSGPIAASERPGRPSPGRARHPA